MVEVIIDSNANGQRIDRFLSKLLPKAKTSLIQKSLRNKNITLNKKKTKGNTILNIGDTIQIFFSDETFEKFRGNQKDETEIPAEYIEYINSPLFEDENFLVYNKPSGLLTQKDSSQEISLTELAKSKIKESPTFKTAPLNRLDRNTSGIVIFPKNYETQKKASKAIQLRNSKKNYHTLVKGNLSTSGTLKDLYSKDSEKNLAQIGKGTTEVALNYRPIKHYDGYTLLEIELLTGKSHQIRSQLANAGYPIVGDPKYGDQDLNRRLKKDYNIDSQLLHAYNYKLKDEDGTVILDVTAEDPSEFTILEG